LDKEYNRMDSPLYEFFNVSPDTLIISREGVLNF